MNNILLALKISPTDVLPLLLIIHNHVNDRKKMESQTLEYYKKSSKHIQSPHLNPFRTRVVHSMRKLGLLEGKKSEITLNAEGEYLYSLSSDLDKYKKEFARIVLQLDIEKCKTVELFSNFDKSLTYNQIVEQLKKNDVIIKKSDDKLRRWLQFLNYCDILWYDNPSYELNKNNVAALKLPSQNITMNEFKKVLYDEYEKLKKIKGAYVPIPSLKVAITGRLKEKGFSPFDFKNFLINLIESKPEKKILLSQTGVRQEGGILYNKDYYHYLSIQEK